MNGIIPRASIVGVVIGVAVLAGHSRDAAALECFMCDPGGGAAPWDTFPWDPHERPDYTGSDGDPEDHDPKIYYKKFHLGGPGDILWHKVDTGEIASWLYNTNNTIVGTSLEAGTNVPGSTGWNIVGTGDFDGDKRYDILWHNPGTGELKVEFLNGTEHPKGEAYLPWNIPGSSGWAVVGVGDYNKDGNADIYWVHPSDGKLGIWPMKGTTPQTPVNIDTWSEPAAFGWHIAMVGDFNGDGFPDLVRVNDQLGYVNFAFMDHLGQVTGFQDLNWTAKASDGWQLKGKGDFNRDGQLDLLWHNVNTGEVGTWLLSGFVEKGWLSLPWNVLGSTHWEIVSR